MKVKLLGSGEIVTAKRFKDLTPEEVKASTIHPGSWGGDEIFVEPHKGSDEWRYMFDCEVEIIEE